jgi:TonB family protein
MPENILVIEYEPRYTDRVKHALTGQPIEPSFVHDGEEALRAFDNQRPKLIVLSSVIPKGNTSDLIHAIRQREHLQETPILLTVSGYTGTSTKQDAVRLGATDILPKPFSEGDFLSKVHQMLGRAAGQLTSDQIFGDDLLEDHAVHAGAKKTTTARGNVDKLLADTLSGVMAQKSPVKPKTQPGMSNIDKRLADLTISSRPKTASGTTPVPRVATPPPAQHEDNVPISQPIFPQAAPPPPVEEEEPIDGTRFGQYVLLEKIATGGMAEVWKARMRGVEGFQKIVAIKKILPHLSDNQDFIGMFIDEAKLAAQLNHNNIIHIYDLGKIQNSYYIAMEYIDGFDLKTILKLAQERDQPLTIELALFMATKIAAALDYAHRKRDFENRDLGLVHRDVSPQNVLISQEGDIKLCDFGIAKAASKASTTQAGALKGKLQYMSPEQAWGRTIDRRSDIFALATVLFEMLTGRKLFTGENEMSILEQVREARVEPPSKYNEEITPEIDRIVLKALEKEPANRYQTAAEVARDLDSVLYEFKPTPTSADLAIFMHRLDAASPVAAQSQPQPVAEPERPEAKAKPLAATSSPAPPGVVMPAWESRRSSKMPALIGVGVAAVIAVAVGGYVFVRGKSPSAGAASAPARTAPAAILPTETTASVAAPATIEPVAAATVAPTAQPPVLDPAKVDEEVKKRLAAERAKLEQQAQARAQQAASQPPPVTMTQRPAPQPLVQPVAQERPVVQPPAPQPAIVENTPPAPVPQPVAQPVTPAPAPAPAPQPVAETPKAREGELIASGSEDVPARMLRRANIPYPPLAKIQRVQGTVLVNALISESGQVLEAKIIRPINKAVGLNEAAEQIVRRSTFSPPIKDGVRVKAWTTVPVDFKL